MTAGPGSSAATSFDNSRWAQLAAIVLMATGAVLLVSGLIPINYGFGIIPMATGIVSLVVGVFVWRHQQWARVLGVAMAVLGIGLGLSFLPSAFSPVSASEPGSTWPMIKQVHAASIVAYVAVIVGLVLGGRHFRRA